MADMTHPGATDASAAPPPPTSEEEPTTGPSSTAASAPPPAPDSQSQVELPKLQRETPVILDYEPTKDQDQDQDQDRDRDNDPASTSPTSRPKEQTGEPRPDPVPAAEPEPNPTAEPTAEAVTQTYDATQADDMAAQTALPPMREENASSGEDGGESVSGCAPSSFSVALSIDADEFDPVLGGVSRPSSSVSIDSSMYEFIEEHGRTYHRYKEGKYFLPNDEKEQNRLDLQHAIAKRLLKGKLGLAPINKPHRVLDIGTGTGIWAIEFAEQNPESDVLGIDLSPIQPDYIPPNCRFEIDDAEDEWAFSTPFDYIHGRYVSPFLRDPAKILRSAYANLRPGGWVEFQETVVHFQAVDDTLAGTRLEQWNRLLTEGIRKFGRNPMAAVKYKKHMVDAGFVNVTERKFAVPSNPWARGDEEKILGAMQMMNNLEGVDGATTTVFTRAFGWPIADVEKLCEDVKKDLRDRGIHAYLPILVVWAQKPMEEK